MTTKLLKRYESALAALEKHKAERFYPGTKVNVKCQRYTGPGMAVTDNQCPPDQVAVKLENGNVWWYRITDCAPVV